MSRISQEFANQVEQLYGVKGKHWLERLPSLLDESARRFDIRLEEPFSNLSWNLVLKAVRHDGTPVVLKIAVEEGTLSHELGALRDFTERGGIKVLDFDDTLGAVMLERAMPGYPLSNIKDDLVATDIFCDVFRRLHGAFGSARQGSFPTLTNHFSCIDKYLEHQSANPEQTNPLPANWVAQAKEYVLYLTQSATRNVLLHGDLHHGNILRKQDDWVVIDPKGLVGDVHFDTIQYLLNYEDRGGDCDTVLKRRVAQMADRLGLNTRRIAMWGIARGVQEACWSLEADGDWHRGIDITERFARCLGEIR